MPQIEALSDWGLCYFLVAPHTMARFVDDQRLSKPLQNRIPGDSLELYDVLGPVDQIVRVRGGENILGALELLSEFLLTRGGGNMALFGVPQGGGVKTDRPAKALLEAKFAAFTFVYSLAFQSRMSNSASDSEVLDSLLTVTAGMMDKLKDLGVIAVYPGIAVNFHANALLEVAGDTHDDLWKVIHCLRPLFAGSAVKTTSYVIERRTAC